MSEPTGPVCPECGTPRTTDGTPACSCARRASDAHRESRTAEAAAAEDFDPLRIRPFVEVGDDPDPLAVPLPGPGPATTDPGPADLPASPAGDRSRPLGDHPASPAAGTARHGRRRLALGAAAGAAVLATAGIVAGVLSYRGPVRDASPPDGGRASVPAAPTTTGTVPADPSPTASTASPSAPPASSPAPAPTARTTAPTASATATRPVPGPGPTVTATPAPSPSGGSAAPVLRLGDQGAEVTELQLRLTQTGLYDGEADGDFDRGLEDTLRGYQVTRAVLGDEAGVYGAATRASLEAETSEP